MKTFVKTAATKVLGGVHFAGVCVSNLALEAEINLNQSKDNSLVKNQEIMQAVLDHRITSSEQRYIKMREFISKPRVSFKKNNVEPVK